MNTLWIVVIATVVIYLAYNFYARRIDRDVIQSDARKATPATMYMDGVDFMPTSKNVLYGYHFKSIAAAGPIVGPITAANLWGWFPSLLWLVIGVSFIGWVSDYSAIMVSVRNDGNSLSAISHKLIAPRTRTILFIFIFFYLMLLAGAFVGILAAIYLNEYAKEGLINRTIGITVTSLAGVPSIVHGLFGLGAFVLVMLPAVNSALGLTAETVPPGAKFTWLLPRMVLSRTRMSRPTIGLPGRSKTTMPPVLSSAVLP